MHDSRPKRPILTVFPFLLALASISINADRLQVSASTHRVSPSVVASQNQIYTEEKKLVASDGTANDRFGSSVAISVDTMATGAYNDDGGKGAVYIFERNKGGADNWGEVKRLTASDGVGGDLFGFAVRISGDAVVVGALRDDSLRGSAYVFERNTGGADNWGQVKKLIASDGAANDQFGYAVGISGDLIVAGSPIDDSGRGSAYVYERNKGGANNWGEVKKLTASDGIAEDGFGFANAISGSTIIVGAGAADAGRGLCYIFERNKGGADNWGEVRRLSASDGVSDDAFGASTAISGDTVIVGATGDDGSRGAAYIYQRNKGGGDNWGEVKKLTSSDGTASDVLGIFVAVNGDTVTTGARGDDSNRGAVYIYERNRGGAENWGEIGKLQASDGVADDSFASVGISGNAIVVGARGDEANKGSAYIFLGRADQWIQQRKTTASDGVANDRFGNVAISNDTLAVSAIRAESARGSVYVFERNRGGGDNWGQVKKVTPSDGVAGDQFGISIGLSGDTLVIGAITDPFARASAYIFERNKGGTDNWGQVRKLTSDGTVVNDGFGVSVSISGDTIVVGAAYNGPGTVYVFERNRGGADNWGQVKKVTSSDGEPNGRFGISVSISGAVFVVGSDGLSMNQGSAYVFERDKGGADNWGEVRTLTTSDGAAGDGFGFSSAISGDTVIVGAPGDDGFKGSAYIYERNKGGADAWGLVRKLTVSDGTASEYFGYVGIDGDMVVVGSFGDDSFTGSSFIFERNRGGANNWGLISKLTAEDRAAGDSFGAAAISLGTIVVGAPGDESARGSCYIFTAFPEAVSVSAASYQRSALAPEMIVAAFGLDLASGIEVGGTIPLPSNLHGTTVSVRDSGGIERVAQLFFVSPGQVNYYMPAGTAVGPATVKIISGTGQVSFGVVDITMISPGIFAASATGQGVAAAQALRVRGAQQTYEPIAQYISGTNMFVPIPVDLGPVGDQVFLVMFGTGFRFRSSDSAVSVKVGGKTLQSLYSGPAPGFVGLDQLNISALPRDLAGAGVINIEITVDGKVANTTTVSIK
jgi:uncharacterized protein (TIGR03437 family)